MSHNRIHIMQSYSAHSDIINTTEKDMTFMIIQYNICNNNNKILIIAFFFYIHNTFATIHNVRNYMNKKQKEKKKIDNNNTEH